MAESNPCEEAGTCDDAGVLEEACATEEFADAPFCAGPSDGCELEERSARGFCPGEPGHRQEVCSLHEENQPEVCGGQITMAPEPEAAVETLPETGLGDPIGTLMLGGAALLTAGVALLRRAHG